MKEYNLSIFYKIFICVVSIVLICFFGFVLSMPFEKPNEPDWKTFYIVLGLSIFIAIVLTFEIINIFKAKFTIGRDRITAARYFSVKELFFRDIVGFRKRERYLFIESNNSKERIKISTFFENYKEISGWMSSNFTDLDIADANGENKKIVLDVDYGWTVNERNDKLKRAKKIAKGLNIVGALLFLWLFAYPRPYLSTVIVSILFPILCLIILKYFKGLILFDSRTKSPHATIMLAIIFPSLGLFIRALQDFKVYDYSNVWIPSLLIAATYVGILVVDNKTLKSDKAKEYFTLFTYSIVMFGYSFGAVVILNCLFDNSVPKLYTSTIVNKRIIEGSNSNSTYTINLTPWGEQSEAEQVSVTNDEFQSLEINDEVSVFFMKGLFDVPWFEVSNQNESRPKAEFN